MLCPHCHGRRTITDKGPPAPCPECEGRGEIHCCEGLQSQPQTQSTPEPSFPVEAVMRCVLLTICVLLPLGFASAGEEKTAPLFNGKDLGGWKLRGGKDAEKRSKWSVVGDAALMDVMPGRLAGKPGMGVLLNGDDGRGVDLISEATHGDCELHVEFNVAKGSNSGIYLMGHYEVQILDSFGKKDKDLKYGDCGGIYDHAPPRVNASKKPGEWQTFDITFQAPRFDAKGARVAPACFVKVLHNGQVIHENVKVKGPTTASLGGKERVSGPILLQGDHGPVAFRNIRLKMIKASPD